MKVTINERDYILLTKCPLLETTERYEFKTDIHQSFDATSEERIPLRDQARQSFKYSLLAARAENPEVFNNIYAWMRNEFLVVQPLERATVGDLSGDFIEVDTSNMAIQVALAQASANPFPMNLAAMATVAMQTANIVATIQGVQAPTGMAHDGIDYVPGIVTGKQIGRAHV